MARALGQDTNSPNISHGLNIPPADARDQELNNPAGMLLPSLSAPQQMPTVAPPGGAMVLDAVQQNLIIQMLNFIGSQSQQQAIFPSPPAPPSSPAVPLNPFAFTHASPKAAPSNIARLLAPGCVDDFKRRREDYPLVPYWTRAEWNMAQKNVAPIPGQKRARGATLVAQGINKTLAWITEADGTAVDGHEATELRGRARAYFVYLYNDGRAPDTWHHGADARIKAELEDYLRAHVVVFQYCDKNWKAQKLATDTYAQWYSKFTKRMARKAEKEAERARQEAANAVQGKKRARKSSIEYLDEEDKEDQIKAAEVARFLNNTEYVMPQERNDSPPPTKRSRMSTPDNAETATGTRAVVVEPANGAAISQVEYPIPGQPDSLPIFAAVEQTAVCGKEHALEVLQLPDILGRTVWPPKTAAHAMTAASGSPPPTTTPSSTLGPSPSLPPRPATMATSTPDAAPAQVTAAAPSATTSEIVGLWPPHPMSVKLK
ncbi:hypothetical protein TRAPUB_10964 [Trametes pubescens]|uniref:Uncharacterized protein n=1 Tax=Trametes pubescens TaxID=154538 RepID=A0A1M2VY10_TRAPU|nr:hypothetical protein TRAPUB_10964 [Trametes pubescens]